MSADLDAEGWLRRFHDERPGCTRRAFAGLRDGGGRSSYQRLADAVSDRADVLDLACGDGALIEHLGDRRGRVMGLELSEGELALARRRVPWASLIRGRAQEMPFGDAHFDAVTCHMALMLMRPIEPALAEIRRVLRPGGRLAFVVGTGAREGAWAVIVERLLALPFAEDAPGFGDRRFRDRAGILGLLRDAGFEDIHASDFVARGRTDADGAWAFFTDSYDVERLADGAMGTLERQVRAELSGALTIGFGMRLVTAASV